MAPTVFLEMSFSFGTLQMTNRINRTLRGSIKFLLLADRIEENEIEEHVGHANQMKYVRGLVEKPEGKRPRGRLRRRWKNNVTEDLKQDGMAWSRSKIGGLF